MAIGRLWRRLAALFTDSGDDASSGVERQAMDRQYVSEHTRFINRYLEEHPEEVADQARGRAIYWDRKVDVLEVAREEADAPPAEAYPYFRLGPRQPPRAR